MAVNCREMQALALWVHENPRFIFGIAPCLAVSEPDAGIYVPFGISEGRRVKPKRPIQDHAILRSVTWWRFWGDGLARGRVADIRMASPSPPPRMAFSTASTM